MTFVIYFYAIIVCGILLSLYFYVSKLVNAFKKTAGFPTFLINTVIKS